MPDVILLSGVSGVGKTYLRQNSYLSDFPAVDIADVYDDLPSANWSEAVSALTAKVKKLLDDHDTVVVEGYFLPGTESRKMLGHQLWGYSGQEYFLHAPYDICAQRIRDSGHDVERRLELLDARWQYARNVHQNGGERE